MFNKLLSKIFNISGQLEDNKRSGSILPRTEQFGKAIASGATAVAIVCCGAPLVIGKLSELFLKPLPTRHDKNHRFNDRRSR